MRDRLPCALLEQRNDGDRDVGEHEEGEGEHAEHLAPRCCSDAVPLNECRKDAEDEHEHEVVEQAEEDR